MKENLSKKNNQSIISNFIWRFCERELAQVISFVVSIALSRILAPEDYGTIALVMVVITIMNVFVDSGLANALIQKKKVDDVDFSSVFYFNILFCILLYLMLLFSAPLIARFYCNSDLTSIIRVLGIALIISGLKNVQLAYVSRNMIFKKFFFATLGGTIASAVVGIILACYGFGVWALVAQYLTSSIIDTCILWITIRWRPKLLFSFSRLKGLMRFGWKLLGVSLLDTVYSNCRQLIIGKKYTQDDLAYYNKGNQFPDIIVTNINASIQSVLFSTMSKIQDEKDKLRYMTRKSIQISFYVISPLVTGLMIIAEPLIKLLLTDKWLSCVPYMRILCIVYLIRPLISINHEILKAMGKSGLLLKIDIIEKIIGIIILICTMWFGTYILTIGFVFSNLVWLIIDMFQTQKYICYGIKQQFSDILRSLISCAIMAICVYFLGFVQISSILKLTLQVIGGGIIYVLVSVMLKAEGFEQIKNIILEKQISLKNIKIVRRENVTFYK